MMYKEGEGVRREVTPKLQYARGRKRGERRP